VYNLMWQMGVCGQELFGCKCGIYLEICNSVCWEVII